MNGVFCTGSQPCLHVANLSLPPHDIRRTSRPGSLLSSLLSPFCLFCRRRSTSCASSDTRLSSATTIASWTSGTRGCTSSWSTAAPISLESSALSGFGGKGSPCRPWFLRKSLFYLFFSRLRRAACSWTLRTGNVGPASSSLSLLFPSPCVVSWPSANLYLGLNDVVFSILLSCSCLFL